MNKETLQDIYNNPKSWPKRPTTDAGILRAVADWLDRTDDAGGWYGPRGMQEDLRRIAQNLEATNGAIRKFYESPYDS